MDSPVSAEIVTVYRARDGAIHHTRCGRPIALQGRRAGLELDFYCLGCVESVTLPVYVLSRIPVAAGARAWHGLLTNGDRATRRVAQGAAPTGPRAVGSPRPVRRAHRGVRASG